MSFGRALVAAFCLTTVNCTHMGQQEASAINDANFNTDFVELNRLVDDLCVKSGFDVDVFRKAADQRGLTASTGPSHLDRIVSAYSFQGGSIFLFDADEPSEFPKIIGGRNCGVILRTRGSNDFSGQIIQPLKSTLSATKADRTQFHHGSSWVFSRGEEDIGSFVVAGSAPPNIGIEIYIFETFRSQN